MGNESLQYTLEELIDRHGLANVLRAISETCSEKSSHVLENWQDGGLARDWNRTRRTIDSIIPRVEKQSPL